MNPFAQHLHATIRESSQMQVADLFCHRKSAAVALPPPIFSIATGIKVKTNNGDEPFLFVTIGGNSF